MDTCAPWKQKSTKAKMLSPHTFYHKNVETFCLDNTVKIENFQKIFSRIVSFIVLSKIRENQTFLKHSLLQVA